jgi:hypothetical protein
LHYTHEFTVRIPCHSSSRFEGHLKDILRSVDPSLDPSNLPAVAQSHISNVNLRKKSEGGVRSMPGGELEHARKDVAAVKRRMMMLKGALSFSLSDPLSARPVFI